MIVRGSISKAVIKEKARTRDHGGKAAPVYDKYGIFVGLEKRETYARVLDYLPYGHPDDKRPVYQKKPLVQAIGEESFVLMELSPKKNKIPAVHARMCIGEREREVIEVVEKLRFKELLSKKNKIPAVHARVYIGEGEREVIDHVVKKLRYEDLTPTAKEELRHVIEEIVKDNEARFISVFNNAKPIYKTLHTLNLLPIGDKKCIGEKLLRRILGEREKRPFSDFKDLKWRVPRLSNPEKMIAKRIEDEIKMKKKLKYLGY